MFIKKLAYASTGIATHHGLATIGIENTHRKVGFGNGTTVDKHKAVGANALVAVAPCDSGRDGVGDGMFHRVYVDVVIATTMHLSERNLVCHVFVGGKVTVLFLKSDVFAEVFVNLGCCLFTTGHGTDYEGGAVGRVTTDKNVLRIFRVLWFQESHGEETELSLDDFGFALLDHNGTTTIGVGLPIDFLHFHACQLSVFSKKFKGIDIPSSRTSFFVT